jgi:hypothetical protein
MNRNAVIHPRESIAQRIASSGEIIGPYSVSQLARLEPLDVGNGMAHVRKTFGPQLVYRGPREFAVLRLLISISVFRKNDGAARVIPPVGGVDPKLRFRPRI